MIHTFSGPTIRAESIVSRLPLAAAHGPIRHGDLFRLDVGNGDTVVIIDGLWHQVAPIRHKEILEALARGVTVIGAASTGALRAAELHAYGMNGIGRIFAAYRDGQIVCDDEVAILQDPETAEPLTVALVNFRFALADACADGVITPLEESLVFALAQQLPYTRRTWHAVQRRAVDEGLGEVWSRFVSWRPLDMHDYKYADACQAIACVAAEPIENGQRMEPSAPSVEWVSGTWRTSFLREWQAKFTPVAIPQTTVAAMLRHQMIYDPEFPDRWRRVVLSWIGGSATPLDDPLPKALRAARERGLRWEDLRTEQKAHWLTELELADLDGDEAMARILVRSARLDTAAERIWPATLRDAAELLNPRMESARACDMARRVNEAVEASGPRHSPRHLRGRVVRRHLATVWGAEDSSEIMTAAARDRAFYDLETAIAAGRLFYLEGKRRYLLT